jgi:hypothetical protein
MANDNRSKPTQKPQTDQKIKDLPNQKSSTSRDQQVKGGKKSAYDME